MSLIIRILSALIHNYMLFVKEYPTADDMTVLHGAWEGEGQP